MREQLETSTEYFKNSSDRDLSVAVNDLGAKSDVFTVLVIDDDPAISRLVGRSLKEDARVLQQFDAPEQGGWDLSGIDLVILDYVLPSRSGIELLKEIGADWSEIPVVFMTGFGGREVAEEALRLGADEYVTKPFDPRHLRNLVRRLSGKHGVGKSSGEADLANVPRVFRAISSSGEEFAGELKEFDSRSAIVQVEDVELLEVGEGISSANVVFGSSRLSFANGTVDSIREKQNGAEVTFRFYRGWLVRDHETNAVVAGHRGIHTEEGAQERASLPGNLRLAASDLATVFREVSDDVEAFETSLDRFPPTERLLVEEDFIQHATSSFFDRLTEAVTGYEAAAEEACSLGIDKLYTAYSRKLLYPHVLSSPFMSRIVERPIGVPGDFDMLGQILGRRFRGSSLYGRIINQWILSNPATDAYRHRVKLLEDETRKTVEARREQGLTTSVLSMASGVAYEVQHFAEKPTPEANVEFTLVDFSEDTLMEARSQFERLGSLPKGVKVNFEQSSVIDLANSSRTNGVSHAVAGFVPEDKYDVVYCAGLYDYLSDRLIVSVTSYLNSLVAEGGCLIVSNYTTKNPFAHFMGLVLDWELIYRSESRFDRLMQQALGEGSYSLVTDSHAVEVYGLARH